MADPSLFAETTGAPLAARMRPETIEHVVGQDALLAPGQPLGDMLRSGEIASAILWGPPGSGKTTIARLISKYAESHFAAFSAVDGRVALVRQLIADAEDRRRLEGRGTVLFCDEIHRFNKAQQDAFLSAVEEGIVTLVGATTENPSFELNGALVSRMRVFVLEPLDEEAVLRIVERALEKGIANRAFRLDEAALAFLSRHAGGDARRVLNGLEAVYWLWQREGTGDPATIEAVEAALQRKAPRYDKSGDQHYDLISALHKSIRGSDPDASLYWLARMIDAGEDLLYITRRLVRVALEDVGLADPRALSIALAAKDAYAFLGSPEGDLALAEATVYLATAPKSNRVYRALDAALTAAREHPDEPVPLHLRNAPTKLMRDLGYGDGYKYAHDYEGARVDQEYLPKGLGDVTLYDPTGFGFERRIRERLESWRSRASAGDASALESEKRAGTD